MHAGRQPGRRGRAIVMIALAYLFVLQGLLAPAAAVAALASPIMAAMPLCDGPAAASPGPADRHDHDACCDFGCLPHKAGLSILAAPPPVLASLPLRPEPRRSDLPPGIAAVPVAAHPPGLPGARGPPRPLA